MTQTAKIQDEAGKVSLFAIVEKYKREIEADPKNLELYVKAANVFKRAETEKFLTEAVTLSPDYLPAQIALARYYSSAQNKKTFSQYEKAIALAPDDENLREEAVNAAAKTATTADLKKLAGKSVKARLALCVQLAWAEKFPEAETELKEISAEETDFAAEILYTKAKIERVKEILEKNQNDMETKENAADLMLEAWRKNPAQRKLYPEKLYRENLPFLLIKQKRYGEAVEVLEKGIELFPTDYYLYESLWKSWFAEPQSDYSAVNKKILEQVKSFLDTNPPTPEIYSLALEGFEMAGEKDAADALKQRIAFEFPYSDAAREFRFQEILKAEDPAKKIELMEKFGEDFPSFYELQYPDFLVRLDQAGAEDADILKAAQKAVDDTRDRGYGSMFVALLNITKIFLRRNIYPDQLQKWFDEEQPDWEELLRQESVELSDGVTLTLRANLLNKLGQRDKALETAERLLEIAPNNSLLTAEILLAKANILSDGGKKNEEVLELFAQAANIGGYALPEAKPSFLEFYKELKGTEEGAEEYLAKLRGETPDSLSNQIEMNKPLPGFNLIRAGGGEINSKDFSGKVTVLNFWATWCGPCRRELPHFQELYQSYANDPEVSIVAVSVDESRGLVQPFINERQYTFPVGYDDGVAAKLGVPPVPSIFILDKFANIRLRINGFSSEDSFVEDMTKLVEKYKSDVPDSTAAVVAANESSIETEPVKWSLKLENPQQSIKQGEYFNLLLTAEIEDGCHLYSTEQTENGPVATQIKLEEDSAFNPAGEIQLPKPLTAFDENFNREVSFYENTQVFKIPVQAVAADAQAGETEIKVSIKYQVCNGLSCYPPKKEVLAIKTSLN